jgi:DNA-binding response OmpR family regulator
MEKNKLNILIVDDEEDLLDLCADSFEMEGFNVFKALDGVKALAVLKEHPVHVVVSDAYMPEMTGEELLKAILLQEGKTPLFYLSTGAIDVTEDEIVDKGATGLISKPFDMDELIERIVGDIKKLQLM